MLPELIVWSVAVVFGWMMLAQDWRRRHSSPSGQHAPRYPGLPRTFRRPSFFPAMVAALPFTAAFWFMFMFLSNTASSTGSGIWKVAVLLLIAAGVITYAFASIVIRFPAIGRFVPAISRLRVRMEALSAGLDYRYMGQPDAGHPDAGGVVSEPEIPVASVPRPGEIVDGEYPANHVQWWRGRGGRLFITSERLVFIAGVLSRSRGARDWQLELQDVLKADVAPRGYRLVDGSLRRRLRIIGSSGLVEYFVVWRPKKIAEQVNNHVRSPL